MGQHVQRKYQTYPPLKEIHIELHWTDKANTTIITFVDVQELANFLVDNPDIGRAVKYVPKGTSGKNKVYRVTVPDNYCGLHNIDQKIWLGRAREAIGSGGLASFDGQNFEEFGKLEKYLEHYCFIMKSNK